MERNPNLEQYCEDSARTLERARDNATATHVHIGVRIKGSVVETGPVVDFSYDPRADGYGWVHLVNWRGDDVIAPFTDVISPDIRPCWDRCKDAPAAKPSGQPGRGTTADRSAQMERDRIAAVDVLFGEFTDEAHVGRFTTHMRGLEAVITMTFDALLGVAYTFVDDSPASRAAAREALASLLLQKVTEEIQGASAAHDTESES